jgi:hypothetical protein
MRALRSGSSLLLAFGAWCALTSGARAQEEIEIEVEASDPAPPASEPAPPPPAAPAEPPPGAAATVAPVPVPSPSLDALLARIATLEAQVGAPPPSPPPPDPTVKRPRGWLDPARRGWWDALGLEVSGYIQAQVEHHQLSEDQLNPDGGALNQDRFLIRRGRLRVDRSFKYAHFDLEIDANTVRGPFLSVRRAEASFFYPNSNPELPPYVMITAGLSEVPFGFEMTEGLRQRLFMERTAASLAFFRGEPDVGVMLSGGVGPLRYAVAVQNGVPLDDRPNAVTTTFNRQKTGVGRLGVEVKRSERFVFSGGVSFLAGTGFHPGTGATKSELLWVDANQDGNVTLNELIAASGQAATPSSTFPRWAVNGDLQVGFRSVLGWTRAYGEVTMATNLDRSYLVADPVATGYNLREFAWYAAFIQDLTPFGVVGLRVDSYDPDADLFEARRGEFIATDASLLTISPVIGARLPRRASLLFQYDHIRDQLGRDVNGAPTPLKNDVWTLRLQVEM